MQNTSQTLVDHTEFKQRLETGTFRLHSLSVSNKNTKSNELMYFSVDIRCKYCNMKFSNCYKLKIHLKSHSLNKALKCTFPGCSKSYNSGKGLNLHLRRHSGFAHFKCKCCEEKFITSRDLRCHFMNAHIVRKRSPVFKCKDCAITFRNYGQLRLHKLELSHKTKTKSFFIVSRIDPQYSYCANTNHMHRGNIIPEPTKEQIEAQQYFDLITILSDLTNYKSFNNQFLLKDLENVDVCQVLLSFLPASS